MSKKIIFLKFLTIVFFGALLVSFLVYAWNPPTSPPPSGNIPTPINTGNTSQSKEGDLDIGGGSQKYWITKLGDSFALKNNSGQVKFILGQNGNVGIGTEEPKDKLDVAGNILISPNYKGLYWAQGGVPKFWLRTCGASDRVSLCLRNVVDYTYPNDGILSITPDGGLWVRGKVGIGVTNPQAKLDVNGNINFDGQKLCYCIWKAGYLGNDWVSATILAPATWTPDDCDEVCKFASAYPRGCDDMLTETYCLWDHNVTGGKKFSGVVYKHRYSGKEETWPDGYPNPNCGW